MIDLNIQVRTATRDDYQALSNLVFFETHAHRHLDWRMPLDWLGSPYFWVIEENRRILASLACPPDPPGVAWMRLFVHNGTVTSAWAWSTLWEAALREIAERDGATVAAIVRQEWFQRLLLQSGFHHTQSIVMLEWRGHPVVVPPLSNGYRLRPMSFEDLPAVTEVDADAFGSFWHNTIDALERAFTLSASAKVVEQDGRLVAYQLSTGSSVGAHLARLAVRKEAQRSGLGRLLVTDLIQQMHNRNIDTLTVNTQSDNLASLSLYQRLGFIRTGEEFPIFRYDVNGLRGG